MILTTEAGVKYNTGVNYLILELSYVTGLNRNDVQIHGERGASSEATTWPGLSIPCSFLISMSVPLKLELLHMPT
jgi:hypothetical protein